MIFKLAAFYCAVSGVVAAEIYAVRLPMGGPPGWSVFFYWLTATVLVGSVTAAWTGQRDFASGSARTVAFFLLAFIATSGAGLFPSASWVIVGAAAALLAAAISRAPPVLDRPFWTVLPAYIFRAAVLGTLIFLFVNSIGHDGVFLEERLLAGLAYPDSYFHMSLASMITQYGTATTGIDGLTPVISYHMLSHFWFGMLAEGAGVSVAAGYYLAVQIVALPLLMFGLSLATLLMMAQRPDFDGAFQVIVVPLALLFLVDCFDWMSYLKSESHMVGLLLLFLGLPLLRSIALAERQHVGLRVIVLAILFGLAASAAKISIGLVWLLALTYILVRGKKSTVLVRCVAAALVLAACYCVSVLFQPNDNINTTKVFLFHFPTFFPVVAAVNLTAIVCATFVYGLDIRAGRERLWAEVVLIMVLISIVPGLVFAIDGGSAYYFLNIGTWIAIIGLASRAIASVGPLYRRFVAPAAIAVMAVAIVVTPLKAKSVFRLKHQRDALFAKLDTRGNILWRDGLFSRAALQALAGAADQTLGSKVRRLIAAQGVSRGDDVLVFVSPGFQAFWEFFPYSYCKMPGFLVPAAIGVPMLQGLPPMSRECNLGTYYGMTLMDLGAHSEDVGDARLCERALRRGFATVLVLESEVEARRVGCD